MKLEIRPMNEADIVEVLAVQKATFTEDLCESHKVFENRFKVFGHFFKVAVRDNVIVGYMLSFPWELGDSPINNQPFPEVLPKLTCFYIHDITLLPIARGSGLANRLIDSAYKMGSELGHEKICLVSVEQSGSYWDKCGFSQMTEISEEKVNLIKQVYGSGARLMFKDLKATT